MKRIIFILSMFLILFILSVSFVSLNEKLLYGHVDIEKLDDKLDEINLKDISKLMIVAHPDDETIFGGAHLLEDDYFVVCVTCGSSSIRVKEFESVMKITNDKYIMLNFPDRKNRRDDNWKNHRVYIEEALQKIIDYKEWDIIVTHNPEGEYGHIQHKALNKMITKDSNKDKLYYFGKFYSKNIIDNFKDSLTEIRGSNRDIKLDVLLPLYASQENAKNYLQHMFIYEEWISYNDWYNDK